jgi:hypothetical protein
VGDMGEAGLAWSVSMSAGVVGGAGNLRTVTVCPGTNWAG